MTVSYFAALEGQIPATESRRIMDAAQAALYPHLTPEGARRLWLSWERVADPPLPITAADGQQGARFYWNGKLVAPIDLKSRLVGHLGAGLTA